MTIATRPTRNGTALKSGQRRREWIRKAIAIIKDLGPYAAIELILPGGSVIAVLLWARRRYR
jgi:hypothetical protein